MGGEGARLGGGEGRTGSGGEGVVEYAQCPLYSFVICTVY